MDAERWEQIQDVLNRLLEVPPNERAAFLDRECGDDHELREEVETLAAASEDSDSYFENLADRAGMVTSPEAMFATGPMREVGPVEIPSLEGRIIGSYQLGELLGRGGMGVVYRGERIDGQFDQTVAIKLLPMGSASEDAHRRFLEERRILARLEHPSIARLIDGGRADDGTPFFVMEYVEGEALDAYCDKNQLSVEERLELFAEVCETVAFAHRRLIIHRDLKPSNILVTSQRQVKLLDFGIAKLIEHEDEEAITMTRTGQRMLTPAYASPEQLRGEPITTASDVYSLGVVLHLLLSGHSPYNFEDRGVRSVIDIVCESPVTAPSEKFGKKTTKEITQTQLQEIADARATNPMSLRKSLRGDLDRIVLKALHKEPDRRYNSVAFLAEDIRRFLGGHPVEAQGDSLAYIFRRFLQRHRAATITGMALATTLLLLWGGSVLFAVRTVEHSREIERERDKAQQISTFLRELFYDASPQLNYGETVTAVDLIDRGTERIRQEFVQDPAVRAALMTTLGTVYSELGLESRALDLLEEALVIQRAEGEKVPPEELAQTLYEIAAILRNTGKLDRAIELHEESLAIRESLFGREHHTVALSRFRLGRAYHHAGRMEESKANFERAAELFQSLEFEENDEYATCLITLADFRQTSGQYEGLSDLYQKGIDILRKRHPKGHPDVCVALLGLSFAQKRAGQFVEAEAGLRECVQVYRTLYGSIQEGNHPLIAASLGDLGRFLIEQDRLDEAEEVLTESVRMHEASGGTSDIRGVAMTRLAGLYRDSGRLVQADAMYQKAADANAQIFGDGSVMMARVHGEWASVLDQLGRREEAVSMLQKALAGYRTMLKDDHSRIVTIKAQLQELGAEPDPR